MTTLSIPRQFTGGAMNTIDNVPPGGGRPAP